MKVDNADYDIGGNNTIFVKKQILEPATVRNNCNNLDTSGNMKKKISCYM